MNSNFEVTKLEKITINNIKISNIIRKINCLCSQNLNFEKCKECRNKYKKYQDLEIFFYDELKKNILKKERICSLNNIWLNCTEKSCKSHTISKGLYLSSLKKKNQAIYTLNNNYVEDLIKYDIYELKPLALGKATTFRGFCEKHEKLYNPVDDNFDYKNKNHIILLAHRQFFYELSQRFETMEKYKDMLSFFNQIDISNLTNNEKNDLEKIKKQLNSKIHFHNHIYNEILSHIETLKSEMTIHSKKASFTKSSSFNFFAIKYAGHFEFSFSTGFNLEYSFKKKLIFKDFDSFDKILPISFLSLINDKNLNCSYLIGFCMKDDESFNSMNILFDETKENIQNTLKCAVYTENSVYSEDFKSYIESLKTDLNFLKSVGNHPFYKTVDKCFYQIYIEDSNYTIKKNTGLRRIDNLNLLDDLNLVPNREILDFIKY